MPRQPPLLLRFAFLGLATPLAAQEADSAVVLPPLAVTAAGERLAIGQSGLAITILDPESTHRAVASPTLGAMVAFVPGLTLRDRGDPTQDPRLAIRGAGARANFGVRGIRVLVDGVPATLPDGQTPLTLPPGLLVNRIEVARGPLAALHGNGAEGVVAIGTPARLDGPGGLAAGLAVGSDGANEAWVLGGLGGSRLGGLASVQRESGDGARYHAALERWRAHAALEWRGMRRSTLTLRLDHADDPRLESPGALTLDEWRRDPTAAAPNSVLRNAGKRVRQSQVALGLDQQVGNGRLEWHAWVSGRSLENPIAAPPPQPTKSSQGTWIGIDRVVAGTRTGGSWAIGRTWVIGVGGEWQRQADDRINRVHDAGDPFGPAFVDQREVTDALGAYLQVTRFIGSAWTLRGGFRRDAVTFGVDDHLVPSRGGHRRMGAWSGSAALAWSDRGLDGWIGIATAFATPTTTELANRADGDAGLNQQLDPSRTTGAELGVRWRGPAGSVEAVAFRTRTTRAIKPIAASDGRTIYGNVGSTVTPGLELAVVAMPASRLALRGALTWLHPRFGDDAVGQDGLALEGHRLPGIADLTARLGVTCRCGALTLEIEQGWSSGLRADDAGSIEIPGWGYGITDAALSWRVTGGLAVEVEGRNLFGHRYVASVVANGTFGRVVEPGLPRSLRVGAHLRLGRSPVP